MPIRDYVARQWADKKGLNMKYYKFGTARFLIIGKMFIYMGKLGFTVTISDHLIFTTEK